MVAKRPIRRVVGHVEAVVLEVHSKVVDCSHFRQRLALQFHNFQVNSSPCCPPSIADDVAVHHANLFLWQCDPWHSAAHHAWVSFGMSAIGVSVNGNREIDSQLCKVVCRGDLQAARGRLTRCSRYLHCHMNFDFESCDYLNRHCHRGLVCLSTINHPALATRPARSHSDSVAHFDLSANCNRSHLDFDYSDRRQCR